MHVLALHPYDLPHRLVGPADMEVEAPSLQCRQQNAHVEHVHPVH